MKTKRNGNIELLRFVFASFVVLHHSLLPVFKGGWLGVEFFFILSGYFMAKELAKDKAAHRDEPMQATVSAAGKYIWKRFTTLFPVVFLSTVLAFVIRVVFGLTDPSPMNILLFLVRLPYDLLFLQNYGFAAYAWTDTLWYLSAMFFALWLLYPLIRRHYDLYVGYAAPMITLLISGHLVRVYGNLGSACEWLPGGFNSGFLRAVSEMTWGAFLYQAGTTFSRTNFAKPARRGLALVEAACYTLVLAYMFIWQSEAGKLDPIFVMILSVGMLITLSEKSALHGKFDVAPVFFAGKLSMVLFLNHGYWLFHSNAAIAANLGLQLEELYLKLIGILLSLVTSVAVYYASNRLRKVWDKAVRWLSGHCIVADAE